MQVNTRDAAAGGIFIVIAGLFALGTTELTIGSALRMGPGFFPLMLAAVLGALGLIILLKSVGKAPSPMTGVPWRGAILILAAPVVFGLTIRWFGLAPSVALVIIISAFASQRSTLKLAIILTVLLTFFCVVVFQRMLGLPTPVFAGPFDALNPYFDMLMSPFNGLGTAITSAFGAIVHAIRGLFGAGA